MNRKNLKMYERASLEIITFDCRDVITTSGETWSNFKRDGIPLPTDVFD